MNTQLLKIPLHSQLYTVRADLFLALLLSGQWTEAKGQERSKSKPVKRISKREVAFYLYKPACPYALRRNEDGSISLFLDRTSLFHKMTNPAFESRFYAIFISATREWLIRRINIPA